MAIDPKRVLLIRNTNSAVSSLSESVSDWYATARGLTGSSASDYFWMGFDFGDGSQRLATKLAADYNWFDDNNVRNPVIGYRLNLGVSSASCKVLDHLTTPVTCVSHSSKITTTQVGVAIFNAVAAVIVAHKIDAVLVLPGVPAFLFGPFLNSRGGGADDDVGYYFGQHLEIALAHSISLIARTPNQRQIIGSNITRTDKSSPGQLVTSGSGSGWDRPRPQRPLSTIDSLTRPSYTVGANSNAVAWGRVGATDRDRSWSTLAQVQTMVNNAKACETVSNLGKLHVLGGSGYITAYSGVLDSIAVNYLGRDYGLTNFGHVREAFYYALAAEPYTYIGELDFDPNSAAARGYLANGQVVSYNAGFGYAEEALWPVKPAWATEPVARIKRSTTGLGPTAVDGGPLVTFGFADARTPVDSSVENKWSFMPGAWVYSWQSGADAPSYLCLTNGGSLGFTCAGEPFNIHLQDQASLVLMLFLGHCGADAAYRSFNNVVYTGPSVRDLDNGRVLNGGKTSYISAHGDPLYSPYAYTAPKLMQVGA